MNTALTVLILVAMAATFGVLVVGVISMLRGGKFNKEWSNKLMRMRVGLQLVAVLLIGLFWLVSR